MRHSGLEREVAAMGHKEGAGGVAKIMCLWSKEKYRLEVRLGMPACYPTMCPLQNH